MSQAYLSCLLASFCVISILVGVLIKLIALAQVNNIMINYEKANYYFYFGPMLRLSFLFSVIGC